MSLIEYMGKIRLKHLSDFLYDIRNISYAIIKGDPLSVLAYNQPYSRHLGDIDILLSRSQINLIAEALQKNGFTTPRYSREERIMMLSASHQLKPWGKDISPWGNIEVDLNFDIFWGEYEGKHIDIDEFLSDTIEMEIYGVRVKTLPPLKAMAQLILHHYKDMNSVFLLATRKSIKYDMFKDLYYLLKNNLNEITVDKLYDMSGRYEIIPYVFYILYYTGQVFDDKLLKEYIDVFRTPEGKGLLNCYGLCAKERKEWKYDFKTRLESEDLYSLIKEDLTEKDREKISLNKRVFLGVSE